MGWQTIIRDITIPQDSRIIAVSDIHGNVEFFQGLMEKIKLSPQDTLVVLGDMVEKGPESLKLLNIIMHMQNTHNIYPVCGNCDGLLLRFFEGPEWDDVFFKNYLIQRPESTIRQMADEIAFLDWNNLAALRVALRDQFSAHWAFLKSLPHVLRTEHLVFVHGGVPSLDGIDQMDAWECMKNDYFLTQKRSFPTYVVVGHCPVTLYDEKIATGAPIIDRVRKTISIDGACILKLDGQLNALIIPKEDSEDFIWDSYDGLPVVEALTPQTPSMESLNIRWGHNEVDILEHGTEFTLCRHIESGRKIYILTEYLSEKKSKIYCEDATDYVLPVSKGDKLALCHMVTGGILAKKEGVTGWYWGEYRTQPQK